jgi:hypothetical protein
LNPVSAADVMKAYDVLNAVQELALKAVLKDG